MFHLVLVVLIQEYWRVNVYHVGFCLLSFNQFSRARCFFWQALSNLFLFLLFVLFKRLLLRCRSCVFVNLMTYNGEIICSRAWDSNSISVAFLNKQITFCHNVCCSDIFIDILNSFIVCILVNIDNDFSWRGILMLLISLLIKCPIFIDF